MCSWGHDTDVTLWECKRLVKAGLGRRHGPGQWCSQPSTKDPQPGLALKGPTLVLLCWVLSCREVSTGPSQCVHLGHTLLLLDHAWGMLNWEFSVQIPQAYFHSVSSWGLINPTMVHSWAQGEPEHMHVHRDWRYRLACSHASAQVPRLGSPLSWGLDWDQDFKIFRYIPLYILIPCPGAVVWTWS